MDNTTTAFIKASEAWIKETHSCIESNVEEIAFIEKGIILGMRKIELLKEQNQYLLIAANQRGQYIKEMENRD